MMTRSLVWLLPAAVLAAPMAAHSPVPARDAKVTAVSLSHQGGAARLAIALDGAVTMRHFTLGDPARLVIDLQGATLGTSAAWDGLKRGIVRDVRVRQHEANVVRVVLEFDRLPTFAVDQGIPGFVTVGYTDEPFQAWTGSTGSPAVATTPAAQPAMVQVAQQMPVRPAPASRALDLMSLRTRTGPVSSDDRRITVSFDNATMQEVAEVFARYSGRSIVVGRGVDATFSGTITDQPWPLAFQAILAATGYSVMEMQGGILRIDSPDALAKLDSVEVLETSFERLNYARAGEMASSIQSLLTPGRGKVTADTTLNGLVITDTRTRLPGILEFVRGLDIKTPTIAIQAKLVFVDRTDLQQLGFKYDIGTGQQFFNRLIQRIDPLTGQPYNPNTNVVNLGGNAVSAISNADALITGSALDLVFTTAIGGFSVSAFLSALERVEITDVEAVPIIHTLDNQEATILSGQETPVRVIDASSFGQVNQAPRANVTFKETGIKLVARPSVTADRHIKMDIMVERSSIQALAAADLGFTIPKQTATSRLLVADGETAVIGGLTETIVTRNRSGIPGLSALPFVGSLFSFTENRESRKDLIILVQPRIVDDPVPVRAAETRRLPEVDLRYQMLRDSLARTAGRSFAEDRATMSQTIHFERDQSTLSDTARGILREKIAVLRANPTMRVEIVGYASQPGTDAYNLALGLRRAESAKAFLVAQGIAANRVDIATRGEGQLVVEGPSDAANAANRRGTFRLLLAEPNR